jgi:hypothetical protein
MCESCRNAAYCCHLLNQEMFGVCRSSAARFDDSGCGTAGSVFDANHAGFLDLRPGT